MRASDLGNHIGATVDLTYLSAWDDLPSSRSGVLEHVVLDPAPDDPRYPRLLVFIDGGGVSFWPDDDVDVTFLEET